jgi:hypothetical protein
LGERDHHRVGCGAGEVGGHKVWVFLDRNIPASGAGQADGRPFDFDPVSTAMFVWCNPPARAT